MTKLADDFEEISRRLAELKAEKQEALTGSSASVDLNKVGEYAAGWPAIEDVYG